MCLCKAPQLFLITAMSSVASSLASHRFREHWLSGCSWYETCVRVSFPFFVTSVVLVYCQEDWWWIAAVGLLGFLTRWNCAYIFFWDGTRQGVIYLIHKHSAPSDFFSFSSGCVYVGSLLNVMIKYLNSGMSKVWDPDSLLVPGSKCKCKSYPMYFKKCSEPCWVMCCSVFPCLFVFLKISFKLGLEN